MTGRSSSGHSVWESASAQKTPAGAPPTIVTGSADTADDDQQLSDFYKSVVACIRALTNDTTLKVSVGAEAPIDAESSDVHLPLIEDESNRSLVALIRGLGDSFSMMRLHHDQQLHNRLAPDDPVADRLFTLLERERFEAVGGRQFNGVARNLDRVWALSHGADALARFGPAEQLEFVLSCLCREQLAQSDLPAVVQQFVAPLRGPVERLLGSRFDELAHSAGQQQAFAEHSLAMIEKLGFDISPKVAQQTAGEVAENEPDEALPELDPDAADSMDDELTEEQTEHTETTTQVDESAELTDNAELVRNAQNDPDKEEELENPDEQAIVETDTLDVVAHPPVQVAASSYTIFDAADDEVSKAATLIDGQKLKALRKELDTHVQLYEPLIGQLASRLQDTLLSRQQRYWEQDLDEGELDPQRLTRLIVDPLSSLIYRVESEAPVRDTAVSLLIDNSRSMFGKPIATAASCADLITRVLERCGVSTEVLGFTTVSMYGGALSDQWQAQGSPADVGRMNNIRHIIYKSAATSWQRSRDNFGLMLDKELLKQNIDGEALMWAQQRLLKRPEKRRILIVISDGRPSDSFTLKANHKNYLRDHLDQVVAQIERQRAIELVAIGIGHQVSHHYRHSFNLDKVEQLGPLMLSELARLLRS